MEQSAKTNGKHEFCLTGRESGHMTGIEKVVASCDTSLSLISACGNLTVSGTQLKIVQYNADDGTLQFEGTVNGIKYSGVKQPLIKRIFK